MLRKVANITHPRGRLPELDMKLQQPYAQSLMRKVPPWRGTGSVGSEAARSPWLLLSKGSCRKRRVVARIEVEVNPEEEGNPMTGQPVDVSVYSKGKGQSVRQC